jgi:hypothetical protein
MLNILYALLMIGVGDFTLSSRVPETLKPSESRKTWDGKPPRTSETTGEGTVDARILPRMTNETGDAIAFGNPSGEVALRVKATGAQPMSSQPEGNGRNSYSSPKMLIIDDPNLNSATRSRTDIVKGEDGKSNPVEQNQANAASNLLFLNAIREFILADSFPEIYLKSKSSEEAVELLLSENAIRAPRILTLDRNYFSADILEMGDFLKYVNSYGKVYAVNAIGKSDLSRLKSGDLKVFKFKWEDPDTHSVYFFSLKVLIVNPANEWDLQYKRMHVVPEVHSPRKVIASKWNPYFEASVECIDNASASELLSSRLKIDVECIAQALQNDDRKKRYSHKVTKESFLQAIERSKLFLKYDCNMLKFFDDVLDSLENQ